MGTDREPIDIECPTCNGAGCKECSKGTIRIYGCPNKECSSMYQIVQLADLFKKGVMPVAGGALDQSASFMEAVRFLESSEAQMRAELNGY